jgi:signal transduction histidine kinase
MSLYLQQYPNAIPRNILCLRDMVARRTGQLLGVLRGTDHEQLKREEKLRLEEREKERTRIARELHDTIFQGFFSASLLLHNAAEQIPEDSPTRVSVSRALALVQDVIREARTALQGLRSSKAAFTSLEQAFSTIGDELPHGGDVQVRIFVNGKPRELKPAVQEQVYLIGREALINALRHSQATSIRAEIEYLPRRLRVLVRDNGCGMDQELVHTGRDSHWGLAGMRERAANIGAKLRIWSRRGAGTEVEISVPEE